MDDVDLVPENRAALKEITDFVRNRLLEFQVDGAWGNTELKINHKAGKVDVFETGGKKTRTTKELISAS